MSPRTGNTGPHGLTMLSKASFGGRCQLQTGATGGRGKETGGGGGGVKCRAGLGSKPSSDPDSLWGSGKAFLRGAGEPECASLFPHPCINYK